MACLTRKQARPGGKEKAMRSLKWQRTLASNSRANIILIRSQHFPERNMEKMNTGIGIKSFVVSPKLIVIPPQCNAFISERSQSFKDF